MTSRRPVDDVPFFRIELCHRRPATLHSKMEHDITAQSSSGDTTRYRKKLQSYLTEHSTIVSSRLHVPQGIRTLKPYHTPSLPRVVDDNHEDEIHSLPLCMGRRHRRYVGCRTRLQLGPVLLFWMGNSRVALRRMLYSMITAALPRTLQNNNVWFSRKRPRCADFLVGDNATSILGGYSSGTWIRAQT